MKKFLAFVMAASMALSLAACGGSTPASSTASTTTEATSEAAASTSGSKTDVAFVMVQKSFQKGQRGCRRHVSMGMKIISYKTIRS